MYALRLPHNPIICPQMLPNDEGDNINGPSLIKVPDWVPNPLGRYYLYFAHHKGTYIRLAWADELTGPWTIHPGGVLHVDDTPCKGHIASPDVHVLKDQREIRLYYHGGCAEGGQSSAVARSADGLSFTSESQIIGPPYMRVFRHAGQWYAICMPGHLLRSNDGLGPFEEGPLVLSFAAEGRKLRHTAVLQQPGGIRVFYSRIGDNPEHIMYSDITLSDEWGAPPAAPPVSLLQPQERYEGAHLPPEPSVQGLATRPVRQLCDPAIYTEGNRHYLLYSVAGESGIAIASLVAQ